MIENLGERLRISRIKAKLKQQQVAERLGVQGSTLSGYERESSTPSPEMLMKIASVYGVSVDFLLGIERGTPVYIDELNTEQEGIVRSLIAEFKRVNELLGKEEQA